MATSTLVKPLLHNSVADSVFKEITSKTGRYYYFLGSILDWVDPLNPPTPSDNYQYELDTRKNIIIVKEIQPSDVAYVVDRINWSSNTVFDMYDDLYGDGVIGVDLLSGGAGYSGNTTVTFSGGGGTGATANASIANGIITSIVVENRGSGFTATPNVIIADTFGSGATANALVNFTVNNNKTLQDAKFYVITDEFNIYKCLDNFNRSKSTVKPVDVSPEAFTTLDGYKWKFMGTIPIGLRNKFLSSTQVPVTTSITSQFYSSGEITAIDVLNTGNNYNYASIVVQGDGYLESDPYLVVQSNVVSTGTSTYTFANITIEPPLLYSADWEVLKQYNVGQILRHDNNYYEVVKAGVSFTAPPVHTKGTVKNNTVLLKYRGTGITANANISSGNIIGLSNLYGMVRDVVITNNGSGYIATPTITFEGDGSNATATVTLLNNTVNRINITNNGKNYTTAPNVIIGTPWVSNGNVLVNSQVYHGTRLYTVSTGGYANTTAPTHTTGTQTLGNADFTFAGTRATGYARLKYGSGYTKAPNISITGDGTGANIVFEAEKTEAILYPYVEDGKITRVLIEDGGIGYTTATLTVVGDGTNAEFQVNFSKGDLNTLQSTSELLSVNGAIHAIQVVSGGYGYTGATVTITGDGTGATANATIINGRINKVNIITEGQNYTHANVTIAGTGTGAIARAIISPNGGHGRDTISELFSKSLAFYSIISQEKNQGLDVVNDYRQFGIIKDIKDYTSKKFLDSSTGSGCWLLSGTIDPSVFTPDTKITRTSDNSPFLVVTAETTGMLVISLENKIPQVSDVLTTSSGDSFSVTGVTKPDVDKYSGELLFIDNRRAFTTTEDQTVSLKTVFKY